ncbi:MAG: DUF5696 domain-containing protein [Lachnospiraceae bacterium]|nr:DUF5696 domain-containing protein [Lachnospiraceae bacterium]
MRKKSAERKAEIKASVIETLKGLIAPGIVILLILGMALFLNTQKKGSSDEEEKIIQMRSHDDSVSDTYVLESDRIKFALDSTTSQFTVTDKITGEVWESSVKDAASDAIAQTNDKEKMMSTLILYYSDITGVEQVYNTAKHSIENNIFEVTDGGDFIRVDYSVGKVEQEFVFPPVLTESKYEEVTSRMDKKQLNNITSYYKKYDAKNPTRTQKKTLEADLERYPILNDEVCYICATNIAKAVKTKLQNTFAEVGYTYEEYLEAKTLDTAAEVNDKPVYNVSMIYRLDGDDLLVEVPFSEIEYPEKNPIYQLSILPYFGAAGLNDEGFLFVPEGSGAIINYNNGKTIQNAYYSDMYGWNMAVSRKAVVHETDSNFGVFGAAKNDSSYICVIEKGQAYASVNAAISGKLTNRNNVYAQYTILARDIYDVSQRANAVVYSYQPGFMENEGIIQRYRFIDSNNYVDMAKNYREYLQKNYSESFVKNTDTQAPMLLEVIGAIDKVQQVVGIPMGLPLALTDTEETEEIVKDLYQNGVQNMSLKLTGYINGGVKQKWLNRVKLVSKLGSKKDFQNMVTNVKNLGVQVYLDGITDYAIDSDFFDGFSLYNDSAKFVNKEKAKLLEYSTTSFGQRDSLPAYYLLKNENALKMMENLVKGSEKLGVNPSFQNVGSNLSADYTRKAFVTRQMALEKQVEYIKSIEKDTPIMINKGNDYIAPYATIIDNMNLNGYNYTIIDAAVPFYEIAIHGYVNYVGEALNLTGNFNDELLKSAEYGAGLSFTVMDETPFTLQNTLYYSYFGSEYDACRRTIIDTYKRYNTELGHVFNQEMTNHELVNSDVTCTTYEDGTKVYVNYSYNTDADVNGITVPSRDYVVVK